LIFDGEMSMQVTSITEGPKTIQLTLTADSGGDPVNVEIPKADLQKFFSTENTPLTINDSDNPSNAGSSRFYSLLGASLGYVLGTGSINGGGFIASSMTYWGNFTLVSASKAMGGSLLVQGLGLGISIAGTCYLSYLTYRSCASGSDQSVYSAV
jgi:hypothetical protein